MRVARHHNLRRDDDGRHWLLTVKHSPDLVRRYFHDSRYGGKAPALAAAIAYRDRLLATIPRWRIHSVRSARNTSGQIGVFLAEQRHGHRVDRYWTALWKEGDRHRRRAFSVKLHGSRRARGMATALRLEKVAAARRPLPELPPRAPLSNTGVLGVCRRVMQGVPVYVAVWREKGKQRMRGFSTRRYGEAKARALAVKTRHAMHEG
jgi:hypothetical protein